MTPRQDHACEAIERPSYDFTAKFYAAYDLHALASRDSMAISPRAVEALRRLLIDNAYQGQRQRLFLYREAADVLATIIRFGRRCSIGLSACRALRDVLFRGRDQAHRAAAEALGSLPLAIRGPALPPLRCVRPPAITWRRLMSHVASPASGRARMIGRSIVMDIGHQRVLVVKLARSAQERRTLLQEVQWTAFLAHYPTPANVRFDIPVAVTVSGAPMFRLTHWPGDLHGPANGQAGSAGIAFTVSKSYFDYPNPDNLPTAARYIAVMGRCARLLGALAGGGIIHTSPIPLFHNRVQQERRRDGGTYEWYRSGRLDRWLDSCAYPNFGVSGLRDFEHVESFNGAPRALYRFVGNHFLSLLLVACSYFRAKAPRFRGLDHDGHPVDARSLFDSRLLHAAVVAIFRQYFEGFVGRPCKAGPPVSVERLVVRIIEEMGVDRYMEEYLRVADQRQMQRSDFERFLLGRGYTPQVVSGIQRGTHDLVIHTGPHLGAFNRSISIPELIEAVSAMAAVCVLQRFLAQ